MKIYDETLQQYVEVSIKALDSMAIGSVIAFAGSSIPNGWLLCDGATYNTADYPELSALLNNTGATFGTPNYKGRALVGLDSSQTEFNGLGKTGGSKSMQEHSHTLSNGNISGIGTTGSTNGVAWVQNGANWGGISVNSAGTGQAGNLQPYAVVNWIIKAKNTVPTMASVLNESSDSTTDTYSCDFINNMQVQAEPEIAIQSDTPTGEECLWINPEEYPDGNLNPITNTYSVAEDKGYSCDYLNDKLSDKLQAYNLYYNSSGSSGEITLSSGRSNYEFLIITWANGSSSFSTIVDKSANYVQLGGTYSSMGYNYMAVFGKMYNISENAISPNVYSTYAEVQYNFLSGTWSGLTTDSIKIIKVVGYK